MPRSNAGVQEKKKRIVVSIHDVCPVTRPRVERMLEELGGLGVRKTSLLVVPDYHHRGRSMKDADFCGWLHGLAGEGHEVVIHGYYHLRAAREGENLWEKGMTRVYTRGEGEFFDLSHEEALRRLRAAREEFAAAGFSWRGFIAPAWLLGKEAERAVREEGFEYTVRLRTFEDLNPGGRTWVTQSLVYSVSKAWRRIVSLGWNSLLYRQLEGNALMRLGLHPPDITHKAVWGHVCKLTRAALAGRNAVTYSDWLEWMRKRQ